jgi:hypothetical protein
MRDTKHGASRVIMTFEQFLCIFGEDQPQTVFINFDERDSSNPYGKLLNWMRTMFFYFRSSQQKFKRSPGVLHLWFKRASKTHGSEQYAYQCSFSAP